MVPVSHIPVARNKDCHEPGRYGESEWPHGEAPYFSADVGSLKTKLPARSLRVSTGIPFVKSFLLIPVVRKLGSLMLHDSREAQNMIASHMQPMSRGGGHRGSGRQVRGTRR